ncbi:Thylakoid lumenal 15 kDa protein 1, chloroplastic [Galdieria sulphuraria]|nr:Thylakoid lumenal 15 kDa protein 1, chloroplastic [Galdieria sulphuraria]
MTVTFTLPLDCSFNNLWTCHAEGIERDLGKVGGGAASSGKKTTGVSRTVTRGVNLSGADFSEQDLSGVSFQQSLLRETDFHGAKLVSASFFGAELSYANLEDADLTEANLELANLRSAKLKNAVLRRAYFSGNTRLENVDIDGADFSEVILRKDQKKYLCNIANGTNSHTGVETKTSLGCNSS